jgi:hypothetical protein
MKLEDKDGYPYTASHHWGWIVLIVALTGGIALWALALYLCLWIRARGRSWLPLAAFGAIVLMLFVPSGVARLFPYPAVLDFLNRSVPVFEWAFTGLYLAGLFLLRHEIIADAKSQGFVLKINPFLTFCLSVVYINYCLNPVRFEHRSSEPISLKLT